MSRSYRKPYGCAGHSFKRWKRKYNRRIRRSNRMLNHGEDNVEYFTKKHMADTWDVGSDYHKSYKGTIDTYVKESHGHNMWWFWWEHRSTVSEQIVGMPLPVLGRIAKYHPEEEREEWLRSIRK